MNSTVSKVSKKQLATSLLAEKREVGKKNAARRLRASGRIPAIVYGGRAPFPVSIDADEFTRAFRHVSENTLIDLKVQKATHHVIVKDYSTETLTGAVTHLDFFEIKAGKALKTHISVIVIGSSAGVRSGGVFEQPMHEIEIECLPKDMPENLEMDITNMEIGESFHVSELSLPDGVRVLSNPDTVLCHVAAMRTMQVEDPSTASVDDADADADDDADADGAEE